MLLTLPSYSANIYVFMAQVILGLPRPCARFKKMDVIHMSCSLNQSRELLQTAALTLAHLGVHDLDVWHIELHYCSITQL